MFPASDFSKPMLACRENDRCRSGLSKFTVPEFGSRLPDGNIELNSARSRTGPFTRNGLVGRRPADGPGSTVVADGQIGAFAGPQRFTRAESVKAPADTMSEKLEYAVFWKYSPHPPRTTAVPASSRIHVAPTRGETLFLSTGDVDGSE